MKLNRITMSGFRSIKNTETLRVDEKVTILIGANDHGKTNILEAILHLNDDKPITSEEVNWDLKEGEETKLLWHFGIDDEEELAKIKSLEIDEKTTQPPEEKVVEGAQEQPKPETPAPTFPKNKTLEVIYFRDYKTNAVKVESVPFNIPITAESELLKLRPRIELFVPPTNNVIDQVNRNQLEDPNFEFMQGLFRLAQIWEIRDQLFAQNDQTSRILNEASDRLTTILNDQWNQGKDLHWKLEHTGTNGNEIIIRIQDPSINRQYTRPSLRSSGFKTYFLLSMIIYARTQKNMNNAFVYLFDEPGTYLHPHAQLDLQKSFETISEKTQLVYTTHSLFLINKNYPDRNRVISKTKSGTKIDQKPFVKNWKSARESLGILLSNNFLIAEKTLLVEGPSDTIYFLEALKILKKTEIIDIDLNDLSIVDSGTSENYLAMAKLMLSEGREVVAMMDGDSAGTKIKSQLEKICEKEIKGGKLQIFQLPNNKAIEEIFTNTDILKEAIKRVYKNLIAEKIRNSAEKINIDTELNKISSSNKETLGKIIDDTTENWFDPKEKISKLSIALEYENILQERGKVSTKGKNEAEKIKDLLGIRGERSMEVGVFEEVE